MLRRVLGLRWASVAPVFSKEKSDIACNSKLCRIQATKPPRDDTKHNVVGLRWSSTESSESECTREKCGDPYGISPMRTMKMYSLYLALPLVLALSLLVFIAKHQEHEYKKKCVKRPRFVPYEYLCLRNKRFPWGDGEKTLFHNPAVNPLPGGYEWADEEEEREVDEYDEYDDYDDYYDDYDDYDDDECDEDDEDY